jgi:hypothetical protein
VPLLRSKDGRALPRLSYPLGVETMPLDSDSEVPTFEIVRPE